MPQTALQKAAMTPSELQRLIEESEYATMRVGELAKRIGFSRPHWWRLVNGVVAINTRNARLIRNALPKKLVA